MLIKGAAKSSTHMNFISKLWFVKCVCDLFSDPKACWGYQEDAAGNVRSLIRKHSLKNVEDCRGILLGEKSNQPLYRGHITQSFTEQSVTTWTGRDWVFMILMKTTGCAHTFASTPGMQKCSFVILYYLYLSVRTSWGGTNNPCLYASQGSVVLQLQLPVFYIKLKISLFPAR